MGRLKKTGILGTIFTLLGSAVAVSHVVSSIRGVDEYQTIRFVVASALLLIGLLFLVLATRELKEDE